VTFYRGITSRGQEALRAPYGEQLAPKEHAIYRDEVSAKLLSLCGAHIAQQFGTTEFDITAPRACHVCIARWRQRQPKSRKKKKRKKPARPPRDRIVQVRLTNLEWHRLKKEAETAGMSVAFWAYRKLGFRRTK